MLLNSVKDTIRKYNQLDKNDTVIIGVSGGPDSLALTYALHSLRKEFRLRLHIAHLDHSLRKDSLKDSEFVKSLGITLEIPVTVHRIKVDKMARKGSLEETARHCRLNFFRRLAQEINADKIALGHTVDDQAETVLMRILRGSGLYGLAAIVPKRVLLGMTIIRPLIRTKRSDVERFLAQKRIPWLTDSSNRNQKFLRNKIRHSLIPALEKGYNRNIKQILAQMAESVGYDYDYLSGKAQAFATKSGKRVTIKDFLRMHPALQRLALRLIIAKQQENTRRITFAHLLEIEDLIAHRPCDSVVDLPKGISVKKKGKYLYFYLRSG